MSYSHVWGFCILIGMILYFSNYETEKKLSTSIDDLACYIDDLSSEINDLKATIEDLKSEIEDLSVRLN